MKYVIVIFVLLLAGCTTSPNLPPADNPGEDGSYEETDFLPVVIPKQSDNPRFGHGFDASRKDVEIYADFHNRELTDWIDDEFYDLFGDINEGDLTISFLQPEQSFDIQLTTWEEIEDEEKDLVLQDGPTNGSELSPAQENTEFWTKAGPTDEELTALANKAMMCAWSTTGGEAFYNVGKNLDEDSDSIDDIRDAHDDVVNPTSTVLEVDDVVTIDDRNVALVDVYRTGEGTFLEATKVVLEIDGERVILTEDSKYTVNNMTIYVDSVFFSESEGSFAQLTFNSCLDTSDETLSSEGEIQPLDEPGFVIRDGSSVETFTLNEADAATNAMR